MRCTSRIGTTSYHKEIRANLELAVSHDSPVHRIELELAEGGNACVRDDACRENCKTDVSEDAPHPQDALK
jgi:hypothetical protein